MPAGRRARDSGINHEHGIGVDGIDRDSELGLPGARRIWQRGPSRGRTQHALVLKARLPLFRPIQTTLGSIWTVAIAVMPVVTLSTRV